MRDVFVVGATVDAALAVLGILVLPIIIDAMKSQQYALNTLLAWFMDFALLSIAMSIAPAALALIALDPTGFRELAPSAEAFLAGVPIASIVFSIMASASVILFGTGLMRFMVPCFRLLAVWMSYSMYDLTVTYFGSNRGNLAEWLLLSSILFGGYVLMYAGVTIFLISAENPAGMLLRLLQIPADARKAARSKTIADLPEPFRAIVEGIEAGDLPAKKRQRARMQFLELLSLAEKRVEWLDEIRRRWYVVALFSEAVLIIGCIQAIEPLRAVCALGAFWLPILVAAWWAFGFAISIVRGLRYMRMNNNADASPTAASSSHPAT